MKPVFYDPERKRWKRLRRVLDVVAIVSTLVLVLFSIGVLRKDPLPGLPFPGGRRNFHAYVPAPSTRLKGTRPARRKTHRRPSEIVLNQDEGLRAAFFTNEEPSRASLKAHVHQIDLLFPDWLHLTKPDGALQSIGMYYPANYYNVVDKTGLVHGIDPDNFVDATITAAKEDTEVFPMLNNYNTQTNVWNGPAGRGFTEKSGSPAPSARGPGQDAVGEPKISRHLHGFRGGAGQLAARLCAVAGGAAP